MYAIVKTGGKQYKVAVGDVVEVEKIVGEPGASVALPALLLVDGEEVTTDADALAKVAVTGEVVAHTKGPKIKIHHFRNKTGYHRRMGHRQPPGRTAASGVHGVTPGGLTRPPAGPYPVLLARGDVDPISPEPTQGAVVDVRHRQDGR